MLIHHTHDPMMSLLVDRSRQANTKGPALAEVHRAIGALLAVDVARILPLEDCDIDHPTGHASGIRVAPEGHAVIIALLRAGLFVAEGIWERLPGSALLLHGASHDLLAGFDLAGRATIVVDAVINTGRSVTPVIERVHEAGARTVMVATLVGYRPTLERMAVAMPTVQFVAARLSERSYVGKGRTDTGSRLFGTTPPLRGDPDHL